MSDPENKNPAASVTLGGELATGWDSSSRLPERLESFGILKQRTEIFTKWAENGGVPEIQDRTTYENRQISKIFRKLDMCGSLLIFRQYTVQNRTRLIGGCTCKQHLLCAFCAARRGVKNTMAYKAKVNQLMLENPDLDLMLLTFTVENGSDLLERKNHLSKSMQTLLKNRNHEAANHRGIRTEMTKFIGGVFAYEFKRGSGLNLWHPHIHMLALIPKGLRCDVAILKNEWLEITGDSCVINIEKCFNDAAFLEVFAYALKFSEMSNEDRWYASQLLRRDRLISSFGSFRGVDVDESETDEILDTEEPYFDLIYSWCAGRYNLQHSLEINSLKELERRKEAVRLSAEMRRAA